MCRSGKHLEELANIYKGRLFCIVLLLSVGHLSVLDRSKISFKVLCKNLDLLRNIPPSDQMHDHFQQSPWFYNIPDNFSGLELAKFDVALQKNWTLL